MSKHSSSESGRQQFAECFLEPPFLPATLSEVRGLEACRVDLRSKRFVAIHRTERSSIGRPLTQFCSQARIARQSRAGSCRGSSPVSPLRADSTSRQIVASSSVGGKR